MPPGWPRLRRSPDQHGRRCVRGRRRQLGQVLDRATSRSVTARSTSLTELARLLRDASAGTWIAACSARPGLARPDRDLSVAAEVPARTGSGGHRRARRRSGRPGARRPTSRGQPDRARRDREPRVTTSAASSSTRTGSPARVGLTTVVVAAARDAGGLREGSRAFWWCGTTWPWTCPATGSLQPRRDQPAGEGPVRCGDPRPEQGDPQAGDRRRAGRAAGRPGRPARDAIRGA